jgi:molybdopterin-guanine dinucleotide biosynthesis protein A
MLTSIILAGGKSSRLGRCKLSESLSGKSLIEHVIRRLEPISNHILIVTADEQSRLLITNKAELVTDLYPAKGPLGGIYTGLLASKSPYSLVVGCDMPFLNINLLRYMKDQIQGFDAIVPRLEMDKIEPLHAIYSRRCADIIQTQLEHDHLKISQTVDKLCTRYVEREECKRFDPYLLSFFNINSPADLRRASNIIKKNVWGGN